MPLFRYKNNEFYYIHIPRTGGRFVRKLLKVNYITAKYNNFNEYYEDKWGIGLSKYCGWELPHLHFPLYNKLEGVSQSKKFTIVRHPLTRFKSCVKEWIYYYKLKEDFFNDKFTEEKFLLIMEHETEETYHSMMLPQSRFVDEESLIWKYEDGFGEDFITWLNLNLNLNISMKKFDYERRGYDEMHPIISDKVLSLAEKFYKKDYEIFGY